MADRIQSPGMPLPFRDALTTPYYEEERDPSNYNANRHAAQTTDLEDPNPIESNEQTNLDLKLERHRHKYKYHLYIPPAVQRGGRSSVKVSLLFCVGDQFNRAGLRSYFSERTDSVLITIPGWEVNHVDADGGKVVKPYGIGIRTDQIRSMLTHARLPGDHEIHVLAAYSTGYRGMIGSVNLNDFSLKHVRTMVFYDCLYTADDYFPGGKKAFSKRKLSEADKAAALEGVRTAGAVKRVLADGKSPRIIIYDSTDRGTPHPLALSGHTVIDLKSFSLTLEALAIARVIDEAAKNGFFLRSVIPQTIADVIARLPMRGSLLSSTVTPNGGPLRAAIRSAGPRKTLSQWGETNKSVIGAIKDKDREWALRTIHNHWLIGFRQTKEFDATALRGAIRHDQFLPEFASEFLTPP